jgi:hypothetical protein
MKDATRSRRSTGYAAVIVAGLAGLVLFCWGARAAMAHAEVGAFPVILGVAAGVMLMTMSAYGYYVMDFKGRSGKKAFALRISSAAVMGFFSMLLARALFH